MVILGVCGQAGSGKDTVADMLVKEFGFVKLSFADPLKRICREVFAFSDRQLWGASEFRNAPDPRYRRERQVTKRISKREGGKLWFEDVTVTELDEGLTPREALQKLGTEWGRECYPPIWVELGIRNALSIINSQGNVTYDASTGLVQNSYRKKIAGVVIPDVRFRNEVDSILQAGGRSVRVKRPGAGLQGSASAHASEQEMLGIPDGCFSHVIDNSGSLAELLDQVRQLHTDLAL